MTPPQVVLAQPIWRFAYAGAMRNLARLLLQWPFADYYSAENIPVDRAREQMTAQFMLSGAAWMFCADADMVHPPYAVASLLRHNLPLVAGLYRTRDTGEWMAWNEDADGIMRRPVFEPPCGLVPCDLTGAGFLLVHRRVFEAAGPPWWVFDGHTGGADFAFLRRARDAGFNLQIDTTLVATQIIEAEV